MLTDRSKVAGTCVPILLSRVESFIIGDRVQTKTHPIRNFSWGMLIFFSKPFVIGTASVLIWEGGGGFFR